MGNKLFGVDIAGLVHKNISSGLLDATLHEVIIGPPKANRSEARNQDEVDHSAKGFIEDYTNNLRPGQIIKEGDRKVILIGDSIANGTIPKQGMYITIEGEKLSVERVDRDPAAATYECQGRR